MSNEVEKAVVNTEDKEPVDRKSDAVIFEIKVKNGQGRYPYVVYFYSNKSFSDAVDRFKKNGHINADGSKNIYFLKGFGQVKTDLVITISPEMSEKGFYITGKSMIEFLEKIIVTNDINGSQSKVPVEEVGFILVKDKASKKSIIVKVKFDNGSYVRLTNFPGDAPVIHLKTLEHISEIA